LKVKYPVYFIITTFLHYQNNERQNILKAKKRGVGGGVGEEIESLL